MLDWAALPTCRLRFLREALDDTAADDCGRCDRCSDHSWQREPDPVVVAQARELLRGGDIVIEPRRQWPAGLGEPKGRIAAERQHEPGRALARQGDGGWHGVVEALIASAEAEELEQLPDELGPAVAAVLERWDWKTRPAWICPMPSRRRARLIDQLAQSLSDLGDLPVHRALAEGASELAPADAFQADQANSAHQAANAWHHLAVDRAGLPDLPTLAGPVLLVDDEVDSRWTVTVAAWRLAAAGAGPVLPFALRTR